MQTAVAPLSPRPGFELVRCSPTIPNPLRELAGALVQNQHEARSLVHCMRKLVEEDRALTWQLLPNASGELRDLVQRFAQLQAVTVQASKDKTSVVIPRLVDASALFFRNNEWYEYGVAHLLEREFGVETRVRVAIKQGQEKSELDVLGLRKDGAPLIVECKSGRWDGRDLRRIGALAKTFKGVAVLVTASAADAEATTMLAEEYGVSVGVTGQAGIRWVAEPPAASRRGKNCQRPAPPLLTAPASGSAEPAPVNPEGDASPPKPAVTVEPEIEVDVDRDSTPSVATESNAAVEVEIGVDRDTGPRPVASTEPPETPASTGWFGSEEE